MKFIYFLNISFLLIIFSKCLMFELPPSPKGNPIYIVHLHPPLYNTKKNVRFQLQKYFKLLSEKNYRPLEIEYSKKAIVLHCSIGEYEILQKIENEKGSELKIDLQYHRKDQHKYSLVPKGYKTLQEINDFLMDTNKKYPKITKVINIGKEFIDDDDDKKTYEGREILSIKISSNNILKENEKPNVLIDAVHHAREIITPVVAMKLIKQLTKFYGKKNHEDVTSFVDKYNIYIIPVLNVDGYHYVFNNDRWWRKNRNPPYGTDLNRNYDIGWKDCGGDVDPKSEVYRGKGAFSEVETKAIKGMIDKLNFAKVLTFHSSGRVVISAYTDCLKIPKKFRNLMYKYSKELGKVAKYKFRLPSADGEHEEYQIKRTTFYSFLIETGLEFQPPYESALKETKRVMPLIYKFLDHIIPFSGVVYGGNDMKPLVAELKIKGVKWSNGEKRFSSSNGLFHLFVPEGQFKISFSSKGFKTKVVTIKFNGVDPITRNIVLTKK